MEEEKGVDKYMSESMCSCVLVDRCPCPWAFVWVHSCS